MANFWFRLVEVLMMLIVPLFSVALAVPPKRSTSGLGIFVAIVFVVTYHKVNQSMESLGARGTVDPLIAIGVPFLIFAGLMVWMYWTLAHKPGGQPIGALERVFARISKRFRKLFRRRGSGPPEAARHEEAPMINLHFFPSKRIAFYMARLFITRSAAVLVALVGILLILDLLGNSGKILAHPENGNAELWRYAGLRIPQLIQRFLPFSALLGALITLAALNQNSEIISMKAAGISAHQIIAPLILAASLIATAPFRLPGAGGDAGDGGAQCLGCGGFRRSATRQQCCRQCLDHPRRRSDPGRPCHRPRRRVRLSGLMVVDRAGGTLRRILLADSGRYLPGRGWELTNVTYLRCRQQPAGARRPHDLGRRHQPGPVHARPGRSQPADLLAIARRRSPRSPSPTGSTATLESNLWHKLASPFSTLLMPLLAAIAAFGLARSGQLFMRAVIGMALGFAYFVADNFALAMGNLGAYPPFLAAWGPFLLFLLVGEAVLIRTEE